MEKELLDLLIAVIIAVVSSFVTFRLSIKKFRSEKWWEIKVSAYQRIIEALHNSKRFSTDHLDTEMEARQLSEKHKEKLQTLATSANDEILKAIDLGIFLISQEAVERLKRYRREASEASESPMWIEYLEKDYDATNSCLEDLIVLAKKDLDKNHG